MTFLRMGAWGLGAAKHTYLYDAFVRRQRVIGEEDHIDSLSVSQVLPGPTSRPDMLNVAIVSRADPVYAGSRSPCSEDS